MLKSNNLYLGDCLDLLAKIEDQTIDLVFLDPPYNLQLNKVLTRPNHSIVNGVNQDWDKFDSYSSYDDFTFSYLTECKRVLKPDGGLWIIGSYHNIFRIGKILQDLNFWILNDVIWAKSNPLPNFRATRLTNAHETLIWCSKKPKSKYQFNYHTLKVANEDRQERSIWNFPICSGKERLKNNKKQTAHPTQKPLALMKKIIIQSSIQGDLVLEPFAGTASFCAEAKYLGRNYIGFEKDEGYFNLAIKKVFKALDKKKKNWREKKISARFICALTIFGLKKKPIFSVGKIEGYISNEQRGLKGFGSDPIFIPKGKKKTFGEMDPKKKYKIDPRYKAFKKIRKFL